MVNWALAFFGLALIAALVGFSGIDSAVAAISRAAFFFMLSAAGISLVMELVQSLDKESEG